MKLRERFLRFWYVAKASHNAVCRRFRVPRFDEVFGRLGRQRYEWVDDGYGGRAYVPKGRYLRKKLKELFGA